MRQMQFKSLDSSIVLVPVLKCCSLVHSLYDLKAAKINLERSQIPELILYEVKLGYNASDHFCAKDKGTVLHIDP